MSVLNTSTSQLAILSGFAGLIMFLAYQASQKQTAVTFVIPPAQEAPSNRKAVESIISEKKEEEEVTAPETAGWEVRTWSGHFRHPISDRNPYFSYSTRVVNW